MSEIQVTSINGMGAITDLGGGSFSTTGMEANDHMHISEDFISLGGVVHRDGFGVAQAGTPGKKVTVSGGIAYVPNADYSELSLSEVRYWRAKMGGDTDVVINDNISGNPRIDTICLKIDNTATPNGEGTNVASLVAVEGTPAGSPSVPATPDNYLKLAEVAVANGFTSITTANITDKRIYVNLKDDNAGWLNANETWAYASADAPTFTFTITGDKTAKYSIGMRIRLTQTTVKYFIVTKVAYSAPDTTVTVYGGTDYTLTNATISNPGYSMVKAPLGFPLDPEKWTVSVTDANDRTQSTPTQNQKYNISQMNITLPIGIWEICSCMTLYADRSTLGIVEVRVTLSTADNSESDVANTLVDLGRGPIDTAGGRFDVTHTLSKRIVLNLAAKTTYYTNMWTTQTNITSMGLLGSATYGSTSVIKAMCAYL